MTLGRELDIEQRYETLKDNFLHLEKRHYELQAIVAKQDRWIHELEMIVQRLGAPFLPTLTDRDDG